MSNELNRMLELWEGKFRSLINNYEDIEYVLNPEWSRPDDMPTEAAQWYWNWFSDSRYLFQITDEYYKLGYGQVIITNLHFNGNEFDFEAYFIKNEFIR